VSNEGERARLEAIVFGRDAATSDAEREAAAEALAQLIEEERALDAAVLEQTHAPEPETARPAQSPGQLPGRSPDAPSEDAPAEKARSRWRRPLLLASISIAVVVVAGVAAPALISGRPLFPPSDSMAIFDRPQTERDLEYPSDIYWDVIPDSVRFVGSELDYDVYVLQAGPEGPVSKTMYCMIVVRGAAVVDQPCRTAEEFASGMTSARFSNDGGWTEVTWDVSDGVTVRTGTHEPIPPPLSVFDNEQDDADLNALVYLPDIPPSQQDSVRFLSSSGGYYVAAYRDADDGVCLAVYVGGTTIATSESVCVTETAFESDGIQLLYPTAAPEISVTWSTTGVAFGGR
jgi:hypothetical protein